MMTIERVCKFMTAFWESSERRVSRKLWKHNNRSMKGHDFFFCQINI